MKSNKVDGQKLEINLIIQYYSRMKKYKKTAIEREKSKPNIHRDYPEKYDDFISSQPSHSGLPHSGKSPEKAEFDVNKGGTLLGRVHSDGHGSEDEKMLMDEFEASEPEPVPEPEPDIESEIEPEPESEIRVEVDAELKTEAKDTDVEQDKKYMVNLFGKTVNNNNNINKHISSANNVIIVKKENCRENANVLDAEDVNIIEKICTIIIDD